MRSGTAGYQRSCCHLYHRNIAASRFGSVPIARQISTLVLTRDSRLKMRKAHYIAVHTDSGSILGCAHKHKTVTSATACISEPGGYVVAVRRRKYRELTDAEEAEFQMAMFGYEERTRREAADFSLLVRVRLKPQ